MPAHALSHPTTLPRTRPRRRALATILLPSVLLLVLPWPARSQGWIEPRATVMPAEWGVQKLRTSVTVRVTDRIAHVEVEEWFRNDGRGLAEGDYLYPLPGEAVFTNYSLYQGETELRGEMMNAAEARSIYERIVRARQDPALIELMGKGMLRARVFPIEPGQERRVTLRYTQVLERAGDALQFRYAAGVRHLGTLPPQAFPLPRVEPAPGGRPRLPLPPPHRERDGPLMERQLAPLTFTFIVDDAGRFRDAFSPTHDVRVERERGRMTVRPRGELTGDFSVFLPFAGQAVGLTLAAHNPAGEDGYFMLTLSPGATAESRIPRDVTVVVDVSGSMSGEKMEQARRALQQLLGTLGSTDRFRLIAFSSSVRPWRDGWAQATPERLRDARRWVDELRADGGTNIHEALATAFAEASPSERLPIVVFMTDGMPTSGETRTDRIVAMAESSRGRARIFAFGVGFDVNTHLLDVLSEATRGSTQYVRPSEDVEAAVSMLATRIRHPVLTDLAIEAAPVRLTEIYPRELPDLFAGEELVLFGRYQGSGQGRLEVRGRRSGQAQAFATQARLPATEDGNAFMTRLWASRRIGDLDRRIRAAQADGASRAQVESLIEDLRETALRYGLLSEHTAYLVQEPGVVAAGPPGLRQLRVTAAAPAADVAGKAAVDRAEQARRSREVASVAQMDAVQLNESVVAGHAGAAGAAGAATRVIAGRTFVLRDGVWQDTRHDTNRRLLRIEPYSDAYFALLGALPELRLVLRELPAGIVAGERLSLSVTEGGAPTLSAAELRRAVAEFRGR
jgi:Ca-activated chloride channel homolog